MTFADVIAILQEAWKALPFPAIAIYLIVLGYAWLWVEHQMTRLGRATPGWRRAMPVAPQISVAIEWIMRLSWLLVLAWLLLYLGTAATTFLERFALGASTAMGDALRQVGRAWSQAQETVTSTLPAPLRRWLPGL